MLTRRRFLGTVSAGLLAAPLAAEAQTGRKPARVGLLTGGSEPGFRGRLDAFRKGLRDLGHVEGQTVALEYRYGNDNYERLPALAAELVRLDVDVVVANGTPASLAARRATTSVPIVMFETADPVGSKIVASLAKPGGNVTGVAQLVSSELFGKQVEMLRELLPKLSRVGLLFNPRNPVQQRALSSTQAAGRTLGITVEPFGVEQSSQLEREFAAAARGGVGAVIVTRDNVFVDHPQRLVDLAARYRMPAMYGTRPFAEAGGLITYGADPAEAAQRAAVYVDRILKGARPADLPVEQPSKFELVVNLRTAKALGLTIPPSLLLRADQVIE